MSIRELTEKVKELIKLVAQLNKLLIEVVSTIGWILIIISLLK
jgi:hypothetical protein